MKWTPWLVGSLTAALIAGCGGERGNNDTGATGGAETESGTVQGGTRTTSDTSSGLGTSDTAQGGARIQSDTAAGASGTSDSARGNQTKSGVTNTETGQSTLGTGVTQTRPDQNQPVTSKGDTVSSRPDSGAGSNP